MVSKDLTCLASTDEEHAQSELPVFHQDWWLKIASRSPDYRELKVVRGNKIIGRLAFVLSRNRLGLPWGHDPYWSHLGGPIVDEGLSRSEQAAVIRALVEQLPRRASFSFYCDSTLSYADLVRDAFRHARFEHSTQITYLRFPRGRDVLNGQRSKHRGHIKRAAKSLACVDIAASDFVQFFKMNLEAMGKTSYAPLDILPNLIEQATHRGSARAIAAKPNSSGNGAACSPYDAAVVYLWDSSRCYYWLSTHRVACGGEPGEKPHPDAVKLLAVKAMEHAQAMNLVFDADGVATPGADNLYRNVLGLRTQEQRDVFERLNTMERLYQRSRRMFMQTSSHDVTQVFRAREKEIR